MSTETLDGAEDKDAPQEMTAIERARRLVGGRSVIEIYWSLGNSRYRSIILELEERPMPWQPATSLMVERAVQDRLLDELLRDRKYREHIGLAS